jgi:hypothetical protein
MLLGGSVILPVFVLLEMKLGVIAGGIADLGGLMVLISLLGMLVGILRYSGVLDFAGNNCGSDVGSNDGANDSVSNHQSDVSVGAR